MNRSGQATCEFEILTVTAQLLAPTIVAIQNNGSFLSTSISPGLIISIYGTNMGPATLVPLHVGANSLLDTVLAGTTVTFDGVQAPIVFTRADVVSVIVPYEIAGRATSSMIVNYNGVSSTPLQLRVVDASPAIFTLTQTGTGQGAILNQNGTVNGSGNPEVAGNVIQIFGTGEGLTTPTHVTGTVYPVTQQAAFVEPFKDLALRLKPGECGLVKSQFGWHVMKRVR